MTIAFLCFLALAVYLSRSDTPYVDLLGIAFAIGLCYAIGFPLAFALFVIIVILVGIYVAIVETIRFLIP